MGGKNCKVFRLLKFWQMPKPPSWLARLLLGAALIKKIKNKKN
jgi:hypothetical protein